MSVKEVRDAVSQASKEIGEGPFALLRAIMQFAATMQFASRSRKETELAKNAVTSISSQIIGSNPVSEKQLLSAQKEKISDQLDQLNELNFGLRNPNNKNEPPTHRPF